MSPAARDKLLLNSRVTKGGYRLNKQLLKANEELSEEMDHLDLLFTPDGDALTEAIEKVCEVHRLADRDYADALLDIANKQRAMIDGERRKRIP